MVDKEIPMHRNARGIIMVNPLWDKFKDREKNKGKIVISIVKDL